MNFIYVIHLMCWNYLIALIDLITHSRNRNNRNNSGDGNNKGGCALRARPLLVASEVANPSKTFKKPSGRVWGRFWEGF